MRAVSRLFNCILSIHVPLPELNLYFPICSDCPGFVTLIAGLWILTYWQSSATTVREVLLGLLLVLPKSMSDGWLRTQQAVQPTLPVTWKAFSVSKYPVFVSHWKSKGNPVFGSVPRTLWGALQARCEFPNHNLKTIRVSPIFHWEVHSLKSCCGWGVWGLFVRYLDNWMEFRWFSTD